MRLLHTSDWHLGQTLHQFERTYEHAQFLAWLLDTLEQEQIDALLVAGDLFDNANPSAAAQRQLYQFLTEARRRLPQLSIILIAGNHDSPVRVEVPEPFLQLFEATVIGQVNHLANGKVDLARLVVPLKDTHGIIRAWCLAIPFLRPADVPRVTYAQNAYAAGAEVLYQQAYDYACQLRQPGQAIIAMGHCYMQGGQASQESERRIVIGGAEAWSADWFAPDIAYVALGHLHLAQKVGGQAHIRYSGSPLPMSFAETAYTHQVIRVDLEGEQVQAIQPIQVPRFIELIQLPKQPADLATVEAALRQLDLPNVAEAQWPYLMVRLLLDMPEPGLRMRIEAALAGKPVRLARIEVKNSQGAVQDVPLLSLDELQLLEPSEIFQQLYQQKYASEVPPAMLEAFAELLLAAE